ncbi:MAG TPA: L-histidine N(alpha)-methyltransferase [Lacipirellulaceae bacterium]|nr:L-histidine N(alpha)-methyltransferase [Lacipirellulaceae bacterium]
MTVLSPTTMLAVRPTRAEFRNDVLAGLSQRPKRLPCKYFYDRRGSMLFDAICAQPEYYLTRTERQIMLQHIDDIVDVLGEQVILIEFGSGSSLKTRYLLQHLRKQEMYVPVDISREHLMNTVRRLHRDFGHVTIRPICADFTTGIRLPRVWDTGGRRVVYFPGSTIGNFEPTAAVQLLHRISKLSGPGGGLLIGIDLVKEPTIIERAYNDAAGVTAEFNLNLLMRMNRELGATFNLDRFEHRAFYDTRFHRVDLRLVSKHNQKVRINNRTFEFEAKEPIHTEYSHKYTIDRFSRLASEAGLKLERWWTDDRSYFGVLYFVHESQ